ncbi:MAG: glucokinase [Pseudomonadota bacterium]
MTSLHSTQLSSETFSARRVFVADIGGTNARFAITELTTGKVCFQQTYLTQDFPTVEEAIATFLKNAKAESVQNAGNFLQEACFAVACPANGDVIQFTNSHWYFSIRDLQQTFSWKNFAVVNDIEAIAYNLPQLTLEETLALDDNPNTQKRQKAVVAPGTGLGVAGLTVHKLHPIVIATESGHASFAPENELEREIEKILSRKMQPVSYEELLSGRGIENLYSAIAKVMDFDVKNLSAPEITEGAVNNEQQTQSVMQCYFEILGSFCGNVALMLGAEGGVYLAGGILPRVADLLKQSTFKQRFIQKYRFEGYLKPIPVVLMTSPLVGLLGATRYLQYQEIQEQNL